MPLCALNHQLSVSIGFADLYLVVPLLFIILFTGTVWIQLYSYSSDTSELIEFCTLLMSGTE